MKKNHVVFNFIRFNYSQKVEKGRNVVANMKDNPKFATPDVPVETLEAKTEELETCRIDALNGGREAAALLRQKVAEWDDMMRKEANYVDRIADGDEVIILSAGFDLEKQPAPAVRSEFSVELGEKSGSVELHRQAVQGAKSYIWQFCMGDAPAPENEWIIAQVTSKASVELTGLKPLTRYWFRVAVVTAAGTSDYCQPIMQVVI